MDNNVIQHFYKINLGNSNFENLRKIGHIEIKLSILPETFCYWRQIHTGVTKILDNEVTHLKKRPKI